MTTAIIGGGAAGFFLAINLKEMCPEMDVTIIERGSRPLRKVLISGGGRCNVTNSFSSVNSLKEVYPRGHRLMTRLFNVFNSSDTYRWFEERGVELTTQPDGCVFPKSQDAGSIVGCLLREARRLGIQLVFNQAVDSLESLDSYDFIAVTTGGHQRSQGYEWLARSGHLIKPPLPSLFSFSIDDASLRSLQGTVINTASVQLAGTKHRAAAPLLITHWGISGPATLLLSSHAAITLAEKGYHAPVNINWTGLNERQIAATLEEIVREKGDKQCRNYRPFDLPHNLWQHLLSRAKLAKQDKRWKDLNRKDLNRIINTLSNDTYLIDGRAPHRDEFVTCGGVDLASVDSHTLESKAVESLFFAGEILNIDGITGGFNFQAAWTTAFVAAWGIAAKAAVIE